MNESKRGGLIEPQLDPALRQPECILLLAQHRCTGITRQCLQAKKDDHGSEEKGEQRTHQPAQDQVHHETFLARGGRESRPDFAPGRDPSTSPDYSAFATSFHRIENWSTDGRPLTFAPRTRKLFLLNGIIVPPSSYSM